MLRKFPGFLGALCHKLGTKTIYIYYNTSIIRLSLILNEINGIPYYFRFAYFTSILQYQSYTKVVIVIDKAVTPERPHKHMISVTVWFSVSLNFILKQFERLSYIYHTSWPLNTSLCIFRTRIFLTYNYQI